MKQTIIILITRLKIANNYVKAIRNHLWIHLAVFLGLVLFLIMGGTAFFHFLFASLNRMEDFGSLLMDRLIGMVMMAFFSMLIFSNLIIALSTTYISEEVEFYMGQPVPHRSVFFVKLVESMVYSSWAFAVLSLPLFVSFGLVRHVSLWFYPLCLLLIIPFLAIPAGIGALLTMIMSAFLPARRAMKWTLAFVAVGILMTIVIIRLNGIGRSFSIARMESFTQILNFLKMGNSPLSPHYWVTRGMLSLGNGNFLEYLYWLMLSTSTALMLLQVCSWLTPRLYYRGWCLARESSVMRGGTNTFGQVLFGWAEKALFFIRPPVRALIIKDTKTFWRDPAQWSQLIILFGLLVIYMANVRSASIQKIAGWQIVFSRAGNRDSFVPIWQAITSFFNMGATCFILSILTTRFVYPMLSLEGKEYWVVGLAPLERSRMVWQKYWLCWTTGFVLCESLMIFSNWMLNVSGGMMIISTLTIAFFSFGLTSLSIGLGASTPNFKEDNPVRIANGLGGTLNVILSLLYIGSIISIELYVIYLYLTRQIFTYRHQDVLLLAALTAVALIHALAIVLPMKIGLKRWQNMEF